MNRWKVKRPKIYPEVAPLPTEVPVGESKLRFVRSNVQVFYVFILLKFKKISYPECFKLLFRLEGALGDKKELQFDLTFYVLTIAIDTFPENFWSSQIERTLRYVAQAYKRLRD